MGDGFGSAANFRWAVCWERSGSPGMWWVSGLPRRIFLGPAVIGPGLSRCVGEMGWACGAGGCDMGGSGDFQ